MTSIRVEATTRAPVRDASGHFWSLESLRASWPSITGLFVLYDDGSRQEVRMTVVRDGVTEAIRIIRFRRGTDIELFTPEPPPMMTWHRGAWRFRAIEAGCVITAEREYELRRREGESGAALRDRERAFQAALEARLGRILASFHPGELACCSSI
jgi:hypothetical protein